MLISSTQQSDWVIHIYVCISCFNCVQLCVTPWTVAHQASLSMAFSRQEYWSRLPCPPPEGLPNPGTEPKSLTSPADGFLTTSPTWEAQYIYIYIHTHTHIYIFFFHILFHYGLSHGTEYSSLCCTVGPYGLSILYKIVCFFIFL